MAGIEPRSIGVSILRRSSLVIELARKLKEQERLDKEVIVQLLTAAPEPLWKWLKDECVISTLFEHGMTSFTIAFNERPFGSIEDVRNKIVLLQRAWVGVVEIDLDNDPESHRVGVRFKAIF